MDREDISSDQVRPRWFIDLDWYQLNNRSFFILAQECLCPKCREQLRVNEKEISDTKLLTAIKKCCSKEPGFITGGLPILESIFRLFLANGNQSLNLEELGKQLSEWRGGNPYRTSVEVLPRLLDSDRYYGIRPVESDEK
ncbi:hypothetical protein ACFLXU_07015 [Chloroflexota bacterium]